MSEIAVSDEHVSERANTARIFGILSQWNMDPQALKDELREEND